MTGVVLAFEAVSAVVDVGVAALAVGMGLLLYRMVRGPHLADRAIAADVFAFLVVGFQWWRHHLVFRFIKDRSDGLVVLNTALLAFVALTPFGTVVLGNDIGSPVSLAFFAGLMFCIGMLLLATWEYAVHRGLTIPSLDRTVAVHMRIQLMVMPGCFLLIMGSAILAEVR